MKITSINDQIVTQRDVAEAAAYSKVHDGPMTIEEVARTREYIAVERARLDSLETMCNANDPDYEPEEPGEPEQG